jgi:hypothetical protein
MVETIQTRKRDGSLQFFDSFKEAFEYAQANKEVWKISSKGVRLVRVVDTDGEDAWSYQPLESFIDEIIKEFGKDWDKEKKKVYPCPNLTEPRKEDYCYGTMKVVDKEKPSGEYVCDTCGNKTSLWSLEYQEKWRQGDYHEDFYKKIKEEEKHEHK